MSKNEFMKRSPIIVNILKMPDLKMKKPFYRN